MRANLTLRFGDGATVEAVLERAEGRVVNGRPHYEARFWAAGRLFARLGEPVEVEMADGPSFDAVLSDVEMSNGLCEGKVCSASADELEQTPVS